MTQLDAPDIGSSTPPQLSLRVGRDFFHYF